MRRVHIAMEKIMFSTCRSMQRHMIGAACLVLAAACSLAQCREARAEDYFAGKQIRLIVPAGTAGGYGLYGQLAAQHLGRFIPGNPDIVISYMPGAGGLVAMNYLYEVAPRDGTVMAVMAQTLHYLQVLGNKGVRYDAGKFNYIGRATANVPVHMVWQTANAKTFNDLKTHQVVTGAVGAVGTHVDLPRASNALLGTKWKIIAGYKGNNETRIALERNETQAAIGPATLFSEQLKPWLEQDKVKVVVQYSDFRHPDFPGVPTIVELAEAPDAKSIFKLLVSVATLGRAYGLPPGVPPETVKILRTAFDAMMKDPAFIADAKARGADLMPMSGQELATHVASIIATPPDIVKKTNDAIKAKE